MGVFPQQHCIGFVVPTVVATDNVSWKASYAEIIKLVLYPRIERCNWKAVTLEDSHFTEVNMLYLKT